MLVVFVVGETMRVMCTECNQYNSGNGLDLHDISTEMHVDHHHHHQFLGAHIRTVSDHATQSVLNKR